MFARFSIDNNLHLLPSCFIHFESNRFELQQKDFVDENFPFFVTVDAFGFDDNFKIESEITWFSSLNKKVSLPLLRASHERDNENHYESIFIKRMANVHFSIARNNRWKKTR